MAPLHEPELVARARNGDLDAFDLLIEAHQSRIVTFCQWHLRDADDAADAAQDTFIRAYRALAKFRGDCAFGTWLHRIAINVTHDAARKRQNAPRAFSSFSNEGDDTTWDEDSAPDEPSTRPAETLLRRERQRAVRSALAALPTHHRDVLVLFDIEGHSYEDLAAILKLPLGTVKSRLNRARAALRDALGESSQLFQNDSMELCDTDSSREQS
ncbi:MAG TPA: sigma-70 family RNA polymerase sigma factor [Abditibacteriaceae bacterium]|jgi:RNA polymerase sigma-70 factor (ECF subfamily)